MVFSGESLAHKCSRISSIKARNSFFYKIQKFKKLNSIHFWIDNMTALPLSYLLNMGGTQKKHLIEILKEIWGYLIERKIHLTAKYIPSMSNQTAGWASRNFQDSCEWKFCPTAFK